MTAPHPAAAPAQGEPTHTPGPWTIEEAYGPEPESMLCFHQIIAGDKIIGSTWSAPHIGNARLFAAAPDLLAALQDVAAAGADDLMDGASPLWAAVATAISKATGATP